MLPLSLPVKRVSVAFIVAGHKVHEHNVVGLLVQSIEPHLERGKHPSARFRYNHLGALLVELIPQLFRLQDDAGRGQCRMHLIRLTGRKSIIVEVQFILSGHSFRDTSTESNLIDQCTRFRLRLVFRRAVRVFRLLLALMMRWCRMGLTIDVVQRFVPGPIAAGAL